jgi:hypothetical protein
MTMTTIQGFEGELVHPSLDIKNGVLVLGFRYRFNQKEEKKIFFIAHDGIVRISEDDLFEANSIRYFVDAKKRMLARLEDRWGLTDAKTFLDDQTSVTASCYPKPSELFAEIINLLKRFIELEEETDYALVAAWITGTYFFPLFSAYPFLHIKAPKRSGKSQLLGLLRQLCFNAVKARPSLAALSDTVDSLRGTYLIDQADSIGRKGNEDLLDILADSYKKGGGKRRVVEFSKDKARSVTEFETYAPKAFASIKELPEDLRDRCLIVSLMRSAKNFPDANEGDELWKRMRGKLYRHLIDSFTNLESFYILKKAESKTNETMIGRHLELWLPLEAILTNCGTNNEKIIEARQRFLSWYGFAEYEPSEIEEAVVVALMKQFENGASDTVFSPQDIAELVPDDLFPASKTPAQRASSVGWVVKKFNLATDKLSRSGKGNRYRFEKTKVEKVWGRYFASSPTSPTQALPSLDG